MARSAVQTIGSLVRTQEWVRQAAIVVGASLVVAICARITVPLPFTPVPLTLQNLGVLAVGLTLGWRRGFAALALYLAEGAAGMPVFSPAGPGGVAQLLGVTGGFLLAYPFVAAVAGWVMEQGRRTFARAVLAATLAEFLLFAIGLEWLAVLTHSVSLALRYGLYWFIFAEVIKIMFAAAIGSRWSRVHRTQA